MRKLIAVIIIIVNCSFLFAFEGNIQLTRQSQYDTTYFIFYVKGSKVRVDEFNAAGHLNKTLLVDLITENITALSPALKLYANITHKESSSHISSKVNVIKTANYKFIEGKKCFQWRVRNRELDCEVTYWVMESEMPIMQKLFHIIDLTENYSNISSYFLHIPETKGFIPVVAVERSLVRELRQSINITSINERKVPAKLFEIPVNYKSMRI